MKQCPVCGSTFDDRVDFCFQDGAPLEAVADVDDPTALPTPSKGIPLAAAVTEIKPRRSRRGMFGRPSVADMLDVPSPGEVPPPGGVRVTEAPSSLESAETVLDEAPASDETAPREIEVKPAAISLEPKRKTPVPAVDFDADTILEEPEEEPTALPPSLSVPVSALAVDVPEAQAAHESTDAPPGLESDAPAASLDDSWFGDETAFNEPEDTQPLPSDPIEDPGFAESSEPVGLDDDLGFADDDLGFADDSVGFADDGLGYADDPSWGDVSTTQSQPIPKGMVFGGIGVLAAAVLLTVVLSGGDDPSPSPAPVTPVAEAPAPAPDPPPAPEPTPEEPVDDAMAMEVGGAEEEAAGDAQDAELPTPVPAVAKTAAQAAPAVPPVKAAKTAKADRAAQPSKAKAAKAAKATSRKSAAAKASPNVWTGAPAAAPAAPATPAANPWGAPTETPSKGKLTITTEPAGAMVYVDDRRIGRSPTRTEVNFGTHKVRVELAEYKGNSRVVNVQAARVDVPFRLEAASLSGRCNLLGQAGASVVMDGKGVGSLPLTVTCSPGKHTFQVTPAGGGAAFTTSRAVSFAAAGETANIFLNP